MGGERCIGVRLCVVRYVGYLPECWGIGEIGLVIRGGGEVIRGGIFSVSGECRWGGVPVSTVSWLSLCLAGVVALL